jgi:UPF0716 protein FxsA
MVKWIIAAILLLPLAEIAVFVAITTLVGLGWALALMLLTTLCGTLVLRRAGRRQMARFRVAVSDTGIAGIEADSGGFVTVLAGLLLFLPGFLTDLVGAALLIGAVRRGCGRALRSWLRNSQADRSVVDLAPEEWRKVPDPELPGRSGSPD